MGSGVAGALRNRAGDELNDAAVAKGPIQLGEVAVTDAFNLDAEYVIHAAAMPHGGDGKATEQSIEDATRNALLAADERECESVVIPALGCGVAGFDLACGAGIIAETIRSFEADHVETASIIGYSTEEYETIESAVAEKS